MRVERDAMMIVRAELCERLAAMQAVAHRSSMWNLGESVRIFRTLAASYGMTPVVRLSEALERALAEDRAERAACCPTTLYLERLHDAIGCDGGDDRASEAMIASICVRLTA